MTDDRRQISQPTSAATDPTNHRFLSPHYDDIPLSCGGLAALLAQQGRRPEIVVLFGGRPDPATALSSFAAAMHRDWGLTADQVIDSRRAEDDAASALLGATSRPLSFLDAIYRGASYASDRQLFGHPVPAETDLPLQIVAELVGTDRPDPDTRWYAPLAVGGHVDHRLTFAVGRELDARGWNVWFYEDLPYAIRPGALHQRLEEVKSVISPDPPRIIDIGAVWETKIDAVVAYRSQMATVFGYVGGDGSRATIDRVMRDYAEDRGDGHPAECFWIGSTGHRTAAERPPMDRAEEGA